MIDLDHSPLGIKAIGRGKFADGGCRWTLVFKDGALVIKLIKAGVTVSVDAIVILEALKKAIPGTIDDAFINVFEATLLAK